MKTGLAAAVFAACLQAGASCAQTALPAFDEAHLKERQALYSKNILANFDRVIVPKLSPEEAAKLADVRLEFPFRIADAEPMGFATNGRAIFMSVASLALLDEIATSSAWLQLNGFSQQTLTNYALMLRYGRFAGAPDAPRVALCVPENAEDDPAVKSLADRLFSNMIVFILLHEIGHVVHGDLDRSGSLAQERAEESAADAFAVRQLAVIGEAPLSMAVFFMFTANFAKGPQDFSSAEEYAAYAQGLSHPVDAERLRALAEGITENASAFAARHASGRLAFTAAALDIGIIAATLADSGAGGIAGRIGRTATQASLAPMKFGETLGAPCASHAPLGEGDFSGYFGGTFIGGKTDFSANAVVRQDGARVSGEMSYGAGTLTMQGEANGGALRYAWSLEENSGQGVATLEEGGGFSGHWGYDSSETDGGSFTMQRMDAP